MEAGEIRSKLIAAATPLFAKKGLHGVSVRELAKAGNANVSTISYYFGSKLGLYEAVLREVFRDMLEVAQKPLPAQERFLEYLYLCGICFHSAGGEAFLPRTASADREAPECPRCLNNDADCFTRSEMAPGSRGESCDGQKSTRR